MPTTNAPGLTLAQILAGCSAGRLQSVGQMGVIPIVDAGDGQDETFAPPVFEAGTRGYGTVSVRNTSDRPTILPTGAAFVTPEAAQDHAVSSAALVKAKEQRDVQHSYCVQEGQPGLIQQREREFTILPAQLRPYALAHRGGPYSSMWPHIRALRQSLGDAGAGNLVDFMKRWETELDQFVAEFELVPNQVGAIVLVGDRVVGVERTPNVGFWERVWTPLIRVCYGSLALEASKTNRAVPAMRAPLASKERPRSLLDIRSALSSARLAAEQFVSMTASALGLKALGARQENEQVGGARLLTVGTEAPGGRAELAGQVVSKDGRLIYASICAAP